MQLTGIHHLTAISAKPRDNLAFYTGVLGIITTSSRRTPGPITTVVMIWYVASASC
jgi:hypothetical protein